MQAGEYAVVPARMALLNIDMQNCFVENSPIAAPAGLELVPRVNRLASVCRDAGVLVIHTRHVTRPDGANHGTMGELLPAVAEGILTDGAPSAELHPGIEVDRRDLVLNKPRYGAFIGTDLDNILRARGIDTVIVSGICTNVCCETTAREAGMRDYHVFFMEDGTETFPLPGVTVEEIKRATNGIIGTCFGKVVPIAEMIRRLEFAARAPYAAE